jgi:hypothetical protein
MAKSSAAHLRQQSKELMENRRRFWVVLGQFVECFAHVESIIQVLLWHVSRVEVSVAQAIFSGVRAHQAIDFINRILDSEGERREKQALAGCFTQFALLNRIRNDILHYGSFLYEKDVARVSNALAAHTPEKLREFQVSVQDLLDMTGDLQQIIYVFGQIIWFDIPLAEATSHPDIHLAPWRYKQPRPAPPEDISRRIPVRLRRRSSSFSE